MPATLTKLTLIAAMLAMSTSGTIQAQEKAVDVPPPPLIPEGMDEEDSFQADVIIRKGKDKVVEEYRVNGRLYMVRITPKIGKPYYLRYPDGPEGRVIRRELDDINTPFWKLFEW